MKSLTSFRFFAALMVFFWHSKLFSSYDLGYAGVSFFFVLSGFILTCTYKERLLSGEKGSAASFYAARFARVYPVHFLTLAIAIAFVLAKGKAVEWGQIAAHALLLQSFVPSETFFFSLNGVAWSLSVEMFFYASFPFLLRKLARKEMDAKAFAKFFGLWIALLTLTNLAIPARMDEWLRYIFPPVRLADFAWGAMTGLLFIKRKEEEKQDGGTKTEAIAAIALIAAVLISPLAGQVYRFGAMFAPAWAFAIYAFACQKGALSRLMSAGPLVLLGEISFSFYMIHQMAIRFFKMEGLGKSAQLSMAFAAALAASWLIYRFYEEPLRKAIRNKWNNRMERKKKSGAA